MAERITSYRYGEGQTAGGQVVNFTAPLDTYDQAKDSLQYFRDVRIPESTAVNVEHGGFGRYSRYDIEQVGYAGGQSESGAGGYYEVLNIKDAPDGRHPFVSHGYMGTSDSLSAFFAEWESVEAAMAHWKETGRGSIQMLRDFQKAADDGKEIPGLLRTVETGYLSPWFYATGNASLVGDYVFPENLTEDPVFTFGREFLVPERSKKSQEVLHRIKTCMGCVVETKQDRQSYYHREQADRVKKFRVVQWHDGTMTEVYPTTAAEMLPVPLAEKETWVVEAQKKFSGLLSGSSLGFEVRFADGGKFVGKYVPPPETPKPDSAGDYYVTVTLEDGAAKEGWVNSFVPSHETPNIAAYIEQKMATDGNKVVRVETTSKRTAKGEKKWPGVYHASLAVPAREALGLED